MTHENITTIINNSINKLDKLVVSIHITHHAGTFLCHAAEYNNVTIPPKACMTKGMTDLNFDYWKQHFGYISVEYRKPPNPSLYQTILKDADWERKDVISVVIMRHPLDRLLAGDAMAEAKYGKPPNRTAQQWWDYAHDDVYTNNYGLRVFSQGDVTNTGFQHAKTLLGRMTYIMDQACLNDNMAKLGEILGWDMKKLFHRFRNRQRILKDRQSARERIANDTLYNFLVQRNKYDIALYEWSKSKSLVICNDGSLSSGEAINATHTSLKTVEAQTMEMVMPDQLVNDKLPSNATPQMTLAVAFGLLVLVYKCVRRGRKTKIALKAT